MKKVYNGAEKDEQLMGRRTIFSFNDVINRYSNYSAQCISKWDRVNRLCLLSKTESEKQEFLMQQTQKLRDTEISWFHFG